MRIIYVARLYPIEYLTIRFLSKLVGKLGGDLMVLGGDYTPDPSVLSRLLRGREVIVVPGDEDDVAITKISRDLGILCSGNIREFRELSIACIGGIDFMQDLKKVTKELSNTKVTNLLIITHYPPINQLSIGLKYRLLNAGVKELLTMCSSALATLCTHVSSNFVKLLNSDSLIIGLSGSYNGWCIIIDVSKSKELVIRYIRLLP